MRRARKKGHGKGNSDGRKGKNSDANAVAFDAPKKKWGEVKSDKPWPREETILPTKFIPAPVLRQPMKMSCANSWLTAVWCQRTQNKDWWRLDCPILMSHPVALLRLEEILGQYGAKRFVLPSDQDHAQKAVASGKTNFADEVSLWPLQLQY